MGCDCILDLEVHGRYEQAPVELDEAEEDERSSISEEQLTSAPNAESGVRWTAEFPGIAWQATLRVGVVCSSVKE